MVARWFYRLQRPWLVRRVQRHVIEEVEGVPLVVTPGVLNPVVFRGGAFLARVVQQTRVGTDRTDDNGESSSAQPAWILDMGTGSGVVAITAARRGYRAVGVDINPQAVRCARANVALHGLDERIEIVQGDLFQPVAGRQFDLIAFNPPFFRGKPADYKDMAWRGTDVMERFASGLAGALRPGGQALVLLSTDGDPAGMLRALADHGFSVTAIAHRDFGNEIMTVYRAVGQPRQGGHS